MKISIEYCNSWGYRPRAAGLAEKIMNRFPVRVEMIPSSGGVFEILVDDKLIHSKKGTGEFPEDGALLEMLNKE